MSAPRRSVQHDSSAEGDQAREQEQEQAQEQGAHAPQQEASSHVPEGSYEISRVLEQGEDEDGDVIYRVRWAGYGAADDTWEPRAELLLNARDKVAAFER